MPSYNYMGPGTHVAQRVYDNIYPINQPDAASLIHDIEYYSGDISAADDNIVRNTSFYLKPFKFLLFKLIKPINNPAPNIELYELLKEYISTNEDWQKELKQYELKWMDDRLVVNR